MHRGTPCAHRGLLETSSLHASQRADSFYVVHLECQRPFDTKVLTQIKCQWDAVCIVCTLGCSMCRADALVSTLQSPALMRALRVATRGGTWASWPSLSLGTRWQRGK